MSEEKHRCGLCQGLENVRGPYCGGAVPYLCAECSSLIHKWEEAKKKHRKFIREYRKRAMLQALGTPTASSCTKQEIEK